MPFRRVPIPMLVVCVLAVGFSSCRARRRLIVRKGASTTQPLLTADRQTLLDSVVRQYEAVRDFNAEVDMVLALGTAEKSKITEYKDGRAYILFRQPSDIRLIGLYPVVRAKAFDMVSNGLDFKLYVPSRNRFLVGKNEIEQPSPNKLENLRPQHFLDAMLVRPVDLKTEKGLLMNLTDEDNAFYIIPVVHENGNGQLQLVRSIWFNRYNLTLARQFIFDDKGNILADARYTDWKAYEKRARGVGADIMIRPKSSSMLSLGYTMPIELVDYFRKQPHVKIATGVLNATVEGVTLGASGVDLKEFDAMSGGFVFKSGGPFQGPDYAITDEYFAGQKNYLSGNRINMLNYDRLASDVMESGKLSHIVLPLDSLQAKTSNTGKVSQIYLKLDDPANTRATKDYLEKLPALEGYPIYALEDYTSALNVNNIPALKGFTIVIVGIGVVIGFAVVCLSMYMSVLQRTREIGILKSIGGSKGFILGIIMTEAFVLGIGGPPPAHPTLYAASCAS